MIRAARRDWSDRPTFFKRANGYPGAASTMIQAGLKSVLTPSFLNC